MTDRRRSARGEAMDQVARFLYDLRRVRLSDWQRCASNIPNGPTELRDASPTTPSVPRLHKVLAHMPRARARIERRVDHTLAVCDGLVAPAAVVRMRGAACLAASALAVRDLIDPDEFQRCYSPFAELVPLTEA